MQDDESAPRTLSAKTGYRTADSIGFDHMAAVDFVGESFASHVTHSGLRRPEWQGPLHYTASLKHLDDIRWNALRAIGVEPTSLRESRPTDLLEYLPEDTREEVSAKLKASYPAFRGE